MSRTGPGYACQMGQRDRLRRVTVLHEAQGGLCALCWGEMPDPMQAHLGRRGCSTPQPDDPTLDHVKPKAHGGSNALGNLLAMHYRCNVARGTRRLPKQAQIMRAKVLVWLEERYGQIPQRTPILEDQPRLHAPGPVPEHFGGAATASLAGQRDRKEDR